MGVGRHPETRRTCRRGRGPTFPVLLLRHPTATIAPTSAVTPPHRSHAMPDAIAAAAAVGGSVQLCIATSFTCPFEANRSRRADSAAILDDPRTTAPSTRSSATRSGQAAPVRSGQRQSKLWPPHTDAGLGIVYHGHDTWGLGVANAAAAVAAGADRRRRRSRRPRRMPVRSRRVREHRDRRPALRVPPDWLTLDGLRRRSSGSAKRSPTHSANPTARVLAPVRAARPKRSRG